MLRTHFRYALRRFRNQFGFSITNLTGLAIGFAGCLLIGAFLLHEYSYDRMQPAVDRLFRLTTAPYGQSVPQNARTPIGFASFVEANIPEIEEAAQVMIRSGSSVQSDLHSEIEPRTLLADSKIFDLLHVDVHQGNPNNALDGPHRVVVTESTAKRYFGTTNVLGRTLQINYLFGPEECEITAVVADPPSNSHFQFDYLLSLDSFPGPPDRPMWHARSALTYVRLINGSPETSQRVKQALGSLMRTQAWPDLAQSVGLSGTRELIAVGRAYSVLPQPVRDIRTGPRLENEIGAWQSTTYLKILALVAAFLLAVAVLNFINLTTARAAEREAEIGIRKAIGAVRAQLVAGHLVESVLLSVLALAIGYALAAAAIPTFNALVGANVSLSRLQSPTSIAMALGLAIGVGIIAGVYPALVLSAGRPSAALAGSMRGGTLRTVRLRSVLVGLQFMISLMLVAGLSVVAQQARFLIQKDLQFDPDGLLVVSRTNLIDPDAAENVKSRIESLPGVVGASYLEGIPGRWRQGTVHGRVVSGGGNDVLFDRTPAGVGFQDVMGFDLEEGTGFTSENAVDSMSAVINETAARAMGVDDPVGSVLRLELSPPAEYRVVGVVRDFNYSSLYEPIRPLVVLREYSGSTPDNLVIRISSSGITETLDGVDAAWRSVQPDEPLSYFFLDDQLASLYANEQRTSRLLVLSSVLSILVGLLGLLGLTAYAVRVRFREIAVRIVFGAAERHIFWLFARRTLVLFGIALVLATPVSALLLRRWLSQYAYRVDLNLWPMVGLALLFCVLVAFVVFRQTHRAANANPARVLQSD